MFLCSCDQRCFHLYSEALQQPHWQYKKVFKECMGHEGKQETFI